MYHMPVGRKKYIWGDQCSRHSFRSPRSCSKVGILDVDFTGHPVMNDRMITFSSERTRRGLETR